MGLEPEKRGFQKGQIANPNGRPKGSGLISQTSVTKRLLGKWKTHPVDKLVQMAQYLEAKAQYGLAAEIWLKLLPYFDAPKKADRVKTILQDFPAPAEPEQDPTSILEALENDGRPSPQSSERPGLETGPSQIPSKASSEGDVREPKK